MPPPPVSEELRFRNGLVRSTPRVPESLWELHRPLLCFLYQTHTLTDIALIMRTEHGLHANQAQIGRKLRDWGEFKYHKKGHQSNALEPMVSGSTQTPGRPIRLGTHNIDSPRKPDSSRKPNPQPVSLLECEISSLDRIENQLIVKGDDQEIAFHHTYVKIGGKKRKLGLLIGTGGLVSAEAEIEQGASGPLIEAGSLPDAVQWRDQIQEYPNIANSHECLAGERIREEASEIGQDHNQEERAQYLYPISSQPEPVLGSRMSDSASSITGFASLLSLALRIKKPSGSRRCDSEINAYSLSSPTMQSAIASENGECDLHLFGDRCTTMDPPDALVTAWLATLEEEEERPSRSQSLDDFSLAKILDFLALLSDPPT